MVRFEPVGGRPEISVTVAPECRGQGWGAALVDAGVRRLFAERADPAVFARIRPGNQASVSAFDDAGFVPAGEGDEDGVHWAFYERKREW